MVLDDPALLGTRNCVLVGAMLVVSGGGLPGVHQWLHLSGDGTCAWRLPAAIGVRLTCIDVGLAG